MTFKPMLASPVTDESKIRFPVLASPKLDGIRCIIRNKQAVSRNMKPIPNKMVADMLAGLPPFDGELVVGDPTAKDVFQTTSSGIMSRDGAPQFTFFVFDVALAAALPFAARLQEAQAWAAACGPWVQHVPHIRLADVAELNAYESAMLAEGYEGVMIRDPEGPYKHGRSTEREGWLLKVKRFLDSEAIIIGFVERMHNDNEQTRDALGRSKRSSHKAGKRAAGTLGSLMVRDIYSGVEFEIGTGFDDATRQEIWDARRIWEGITVKYSYQPTGVKDKPRFPVYLGVRFDC